MYCYYTCSAGQATNRCHNPYDAHLWPSHAEACTVVPGHSLKIVLTFECKLHMSKARKARLSRIFIDSSGPMAYIPGHCRCTCACDGVAWGLGQSMHSVSLKHGRASQRGWWWVIPLLGLCVALCGCTRPTAARRLPPHMPPPAAVEAPVLAAATYVLEEVRPFSTPDSTQVVMAVSGPVQPLVQRLPQPDRVEIDLPDTRLAFQWPQPHISVADGRLQTLQVAQHQANSVRITLVLQNVQDYHVAVAAAPHRVTVTLRGTVTRASPSRAPVVSKGAPRATATPPLTRIERHARALSAPLICLDPGHGGHDPGAIGPTGLEEKTVVLQVAKELRQLLQREMPHYRVMLTREDDVFLPLAERARMANVQQAQIFISIHANSSPNRDASGIETWYLSFAASERAKKIAARENMMSEKQLSMLELILRDLHETDRINQSAVLAQSIQRALAEHLRSHYPGIIPRGVEGAPFVVLHRTAMPSVLVETGFISNPHEEARLRTRQYQRALAQGILLGLRRFLQTTVVAMD